MKSHVIEKVLRLTSRKEKYLVVAAVRFLRTCISLKVSYLDPLLLCLIVFLDDIWFSARFNQVLVLQFHELNISSLKLWVIGTFSLPFSTQ